MEYNEKQCNEYYYEIAQHKQIDEYSIKQLHEIEVNCIKGNNFNITKILNPFTIKDQCTLINTKKTNYYIHNYDPDRILNAIENLDINETIRNEYINNIKKTFDIKPKSNCCNCISITLYRKEGARTPIYSYLKSIRRTIKNVALFLHDWIIKLYIDKSVYNYIYTTNDDIKDSVDIMNFILTQKNVEVYTYLCENVLNGKISIDKTRITRFLPIIEEDVNINIIREADGFITYLDCYNINCFSKSSAIFYSLDISGECEPNKNRKMTLYDPDNNKVNLRSYSEWLNDYKLINMEYFLENKKTNVVDLLAGMTGFSLRTKKGVFFKAIEELQQLNLQKHMVTGFDEILLLSLYKEFISFKFKKQSQTERSVWYPLSESSYTIKKILGTVLMNNYFNVEYIPLYLSSENNTPITHILHQLLNKKIIINTNEQIKQIEHVIHNKIQDTIIPINYILTAIDVMLINNINDTSHAYNIAIERQYLSENKLFCECDGLETLLNVPYSDIYEDIFNIYYDDINNKTGGLYITKMTKNKYKKRYKIVL